MQGLATRRSWAIAGKVESDPDRPSYLGPAPILLPLRPPQVRRCRGEVAVIQEPRYLLRTYGYIRQYYQLNPGQQRATSPSVQVYDLHVVIAGLFRHDGDGARRTATSQDGGGHHAE